MAEVLKMRFLVRSRTAAEWTAINEILLASTSGTGAREMGMEEDTGKFKLGDGVTAWNDLAYQRAVNSGKIPPNVQTGTSYTLIAGDVGDDVQCGNASPVTVTIPKDTFTVGDWLLSSQTGAGIVTYVGAAGVTFETAGTKVTIGKGDVIGLEMIAANVWRFIGGIPGIGDAPSDSTTYGRKNGAWVAAGGAAQALVVLNKKTASYTLALTDFPANGTIIDVQITASGATNVTFPTNATVAAPIGSQVIFSAWGTGMVTALAASGVTLINPFGAATTAQYDSRYARKVDTDTWQIL
ncbi:MAG: hypothetical protein ABI114_11085 [Rhodanobacter sp.]